MVPEVLHGLDSIVVVLGEGMFLAVAISNASRRREREKVEIKKRGSGREKHNLVREQ